MLPGTLTKGTLSLCARISLSRSRSAFFSPRVSVSVSLSLPLSLLTSLSSLSLSAPPSGPLLLLQAHGPETERASDALDSLSWSSC